MNSKTITGLVALLLIVSPLAAMSSSAEHAAEHTSDFVNTCVESDGADCPVDTELGAAVGQDIAYLSGQAPEGDGYLAVFGIAGVPLPPQAVTEDHTLSASLTVEGAPYTAGSVQFILANGTDQLAADATHDADGTWQATFLYDELVALLDSRVALIDLSVSFEGAESHHNAASQILALADAEFADAVEDTLGATPVVFLDAEVRSAVPHDPIILPLEGTTGGAAIPSPFPDGSFVPQDLVLHDGSTQFGVYDPLYFTDGDMDQDGDKDLAELAGNCRSNPFSSASTCDDPTAGNEPTTLPDVADDDEDLTPNFLDQCDGGSDGIPLVEPTPDTDGDGELDTCDDDDDGDGTPDADDNCPLTASADLSDPDGDGIGTPCDPDWDNDGVANGDDDCPTDDRGSIDTDGDLACNEWDPDDDGDGDADGDDNCPLAANPNQEDLDDDGTGDACDPDQDGDGLEEPADLDDRDPETPVPSQLPVSVPTSITHEDCDADFPTDLFTHDATEECYQDPDPMGPVELVLSIVGGILLTVDEDEDGVPSLLDNCPTMANPGQEDGDLDGVGNECDEEHAFDCPDEGLALLCGFIETPPEGPKDVTKALLPNCWTPEGENTTFCYSGNGTLGIRVRFLGASRTI